MRGWPTVLDWYERKVHPEWDRIYPALSPFCSRHSLRRVLELPARVEDQREAESCPRILERTSGRWLAPGVLLIALEASYGERFRVDGITYKSRGRLEPQGPSGHWRAELLVE